MQYGLFADNIVSFKKKEKFPYFIFFVSITRWLHQLLFNLDDSFL